MEENKCFECGVQEVIHSPLWTFVWELTIGCHSAHCVNPSRISGFVLSAATSVAAVMSADMPTSTLRKRNIRMQCSSQTTASGIMLEVCTELYEIWPKVLLEGITVIVIY